MRISKWYLAVCAAAFCAGFMTVRADDTPAQAAARAALEEKLRELDTQSAPTNAQTPAPAIPEQSAQPAAAATVSPTPPPAEQPQVTAPTTSEQPAPPAAAATVSPTPPPAENSQATSADQAAAQAAMAQKTNELNAQQSQPPPVMVTPSGATVQQSTNQPAAATTMPSTPPPMEKPPMTAAPSVAPAQTREPATPTDSRSDNSLFRPVPPPSGGIPAGAALEENTPSSTTSTAPTAVQTPAPAPVQSVPMKSSQNDQAFYPGKELGLQPIAAPPLPISADQQAQLRALLEKYDAGTITPVQYQTEREKILAKPR